MFPDRLQYPKLKPLGWPPPLPLHRSKTLLQWHNTRRDLGLSSQHQNRNPKYVPLLIYSITNLTNIDLARKPIVSRGVLLDWYSYAQREKLPLSPFTKSAIPLAHLQKIAVEQGVTFRQGDILLIRTGWTAAYHLLTEDEKEHLGGRDDRASVGIEATEESLRWHWENGFAAVASDTVAYEAWPPPKVWGVSMHEVSISVCIIIRLG